MSILPIVVTGVGIPVISQWIWEGAKSFKSEVTIRNVALASIVGMGISALALQLTQPEETARARAPVTEGYETKSVSDVTAQIGTGTGLGILYPGSMPPAGPKNGELVYID